MWYGPVPFTYSKFTWPNHSFSETRFGWPEQIRTDLALVFRANINKDGSAATDLIARITECIAVLTICTK